MIESLEEIDRAIVLTVNGWNTPFWDEVMWIISGKLTWIPFYLFIVFLSWKSVGWKSTLFFVLCAGIVVAITDQSSTHLFKNVFERYRPSHHALLTDKLHFYAMEDGFYKGGMYGFVSAHAANFFGICMFALFHLRKKFPTMIPVLVVVATLVSFSRIYLGVHYLSDVLVGGILGTLSAWFVYRFIFTTIMARITTEK